VDAVLAVADELKQTAAGTGPQARPAARETQETFSRDELRRYVRRNLEKLDCVAVNCGNRLPALAPPVREVRACLSATLTLLDSPGALDLEDLERRFTSLEEKLLAVATVHANDDLLLGIRREMDRQLSPYRRKMTAAQLAQVERQYIHKRLFEEFHLPRLSLFYML
jgi:hypothetical protein